jgi:hypothetical protein
MVTCDALSSTPATTKTRGCNPRAWGGEEEFGSSLFTEEELTQLRNRVDQEQTRAGLTSSDLLPRTKRASSDAWCLLSLGGSKAPPGVSARELVDVDEARTVRISVIKTRIDQRLVLSGSFFNPELSQLNPDFTPDRNRSATGRPKRLPARPSSPPLRPSG